MKEFIVNKLRKIKFLRRMLRKYRKYRRDKAYAEFCQNNEVQENLIIFESFMGRKYACSPKAIYQAMLQDPRFKDFQFVWAFRSKIKDEKAQIEDLKHAKIISYNTIEHCEYSSKAKYFVTNSRLPAFFIKREGQVYIQSWHGTPLKRLGFDIVGEGANAVHTLDRLKEMYSSDASRYTYLLSPSAFTTEKLTGAFNLTENNPDIEIIEEGYPRNDFLFNYTDNDVKRMKNAIGIDTDKKIILYAPTWRDNQHVGGVGYTYDLGIDFGKLQEELSDEYSILFRPHYFVANSFDFEKYAGFVYNVANVEDINDLYILADILITDYSSVFFDYANLKRPILFYMYDLKEYAEDIRGFYISLEELPGPIVEEEDELISLLKNAEFCYDEKYECFNKRFNYLDDGKASERVIEKTIVKDSFC